jgi:hypothetical protein
MKLKEWTLPLLLLSLSIVFLGSGLGIYFGPTEITYYKNNQIDRVEYMIINGISTLIFVPVTIVLLIFGLYLSGRLIELPKERRIFDKQTVRKGDKAMMCLVILSVLFLLTGLTYGASHPNRIVYIE